MLHKEFLIAFAEGKPVECRCIPAQGSWGAVEQDDPLEIFDDKAYEFRIKPRTIKVERWVTLYGPWAGDAPREALFYCEADSRARAAWLRSQGHTILAEAVHLCAEVEVAE